MILTKAKKRKGTQQINAPVADENIRTHSSVVVTVNLLSVSLDWYLMGLQITLLFSPLNPALS